MGQVRRVASVVSSAAGVAIVACLGFTGRLGAQAPQSAAPPSGPLAPEKYKNIQVLTDVSADQLLPTMQYFVQATGLPCESCHVADPTTHDLAYEKDDSRAKQTARQMISLVKTVNAGSFGVRIQCATCHQGHNQPPALAMAVPLTDDQLAALASQAARQSGAGRAGAPAAGGGRGQAPAGPAVDDVLAKYMDALGGQAAVAKLQSRTMVGTVVNRQRQSTRVTVDEKGSKYRESLQPSGDVLGFDGTSGWRSSGTQVHDLAGFPLWLVMRSADVTLPLRLKTDYQLQSARPRPLPGTTTSVNVLQGPPLVGGVALANATEAFYFDAGTGLLVRRTLSVRTPMGTLLAQTDFADYRAVSGVKMPFSIIDSTPQSLDTFTVTDITANPSIDDAKFARPRGQ